VGSTNLSKYDLNKRILQAKNNVAIEFEKLAGRAKWKNKRVKKENITKSWKMPKKSSIF